MSDHANPKPSYHTTAFPIHMPLLTYPLTESETDRQTDIWTDNESDNS